MDLDKLYSIKEFANFLGYEHSKNITIAIDKYTFLPQPAKVTTNPNGTKNKFWTIDQILDAKKKIDEFRLPSGQVKLSYVENKYGDGKNISIRGYLNTKQLIEYLKITTNHLEKLKFTQVWFPDGERKQGCGNDLFYKKEKADFIKFCLQNAPKDSRGNFKYEEMNEKYKNQIRKDELSFLAKDFLRRPFLKLENKDETQAR